MKTSYCGHGVFPLPAERCLLCGREAGAAALGLRIKGKHICANCEKALIGSCCRDENYSHYVNGLKNIWRCPVA
ncbi:hypothetical protein DCCM_3485 [Desulfocucumis palustris]|uniref:Uncharacterized protein n=1 Tax=Desulfocucumis palustris TaxID=1898651 RepID=A0A2L2XFA3_9FIRM|nr:sigma factor G inhibitor Gin [Desulfocucumis palustris]GBF34373.1 hypothetical protein DCCM_3485 [Desulfocucumis palustris]